MLVVDVLVVLVVVEVVDVVVVDVVVEVVVVVVVGRKLPGTTCNSCSLKLKINPPDMIRSLRKRGNEKKGKQQHGKSMK